jgi:glutathione S-transferase
MKPRPIQDSGLNRGCFFYFILVSHLDPWQAVEAVAQASGGSAAGQKFVPQDVNHVAWDDVCAPVFERQLEVSGGPFLLGAQFSAIDAVFMHSLRALDDKMAASTGASWIRADKTPRLAAYAALVKQRESRQLAYSIPDGADALWSREVCEKHNITFLNLPQ